MSAFKREMPPSLVDPPVAGKKRVMREAEPLQESNIMAPNQKSNMMSSITSPLPSQKTGGTLPSVVSQQNMYRERLPLLKQPLEHKNSNAAKDHSEVPSIEKMVDDLCLYSKVSANSDLTESEMQRFIDFFSLISDDQNTRTQKLNQLNTVEGRLNLMRFQYLNGEPEQVKRPVQLFFFYIIQYFMEANPYTNLTGLIEIINCFLKTYKQRFFAEGRFNYSTLQDALHANDSIDTNSIAYQQIMKDLQQFKRTILNYYEKIFTLFSNQDSPNSTLQKLKKKEAYALRLSTHIWNGYKNVMDCEKKDQYTKTIQHPEQLSTFIRGLNCCHAINSKFFEKRLVTASILPLVVQQIPLFEHSQAVAIQQIDKLVFKLFLDKPYDVSLNTKQADQLISHQRMARYPYLRQLTNHPLKYAELKPLNSQQHVVFLQKLLQSNRSYDEYEPDKAVFVFESICQTIQSNLAQFKSRKQTNYLYIMKYIKYIEQSLDNKQQNGNDHKGIVNLCRYCKLLNIISLQPNEQGVSITMQDFTNNKYLAYKIIEDIMKLITVEEDEVRNLQGQLSQHNVSFQILYEFILRLITIDALYFSNKVDTVSRYFGSIDAFYIKIIINYLDQYAQVYVYEGQNCIVCLEALNKIIQEESYKQISENILKQLSNLQLINVQLIDETNRVSYCKTRLVFIVEALGNNAQNYAALSRHLLSLIHFNEDLLHCGWADKNSQQLKQISENYHPYNVPQYAEILIEALKYLHKYPQKLRQVEQRFNFKFITRFLNYALCLKFEEHQPYNKCMRTFMYSHLSTAVRLLQSMTSLYLKEKQLKRLQMVPQQVRKLLELSNKHGNYQLQFGKEAASYSAALAVLSLSKQFSIMRNLSQFSPNLKKEIYQTLINLNNISNLLGHENSLKILQIQNKQWEHELNESLRLKQELVEQIARKPSYVGLEYLISCGTEKMETKKELFEKIRSVRQQPTLAINKVKSHFIIAYWSEITLNNNNKKELTAGYEFVSRELEEIGRFLDEPKQQYQPEKEETRKSILENIYLFSILLKTTSLTHYTQFLIKYHILLFQHLPNQQDSHLIQLPNNYRQTLLLFFTARTFLPNELYRKLQMQQEIHERVYNFLISVIQLTHRKDYNGDLNDSTLLEIVEYGVAFLIDICDPSEDRKVDQWLGKLLFALQKRPHKAKQMSTKQLLILLLIHGRMSSHISCEEMNFTNPYWMLHLNVLQQDVKFASLVLLDLEAIINQNPIFFMSACRYLVSMAKTPQLQYLETVKDYKNSKNLFNIITTVLNRSISGQKSYHLIWIVEILIQILHNQTLEEKQRHEFYANVRFMIISNRLIHQRIQELLTKTALIYGLSTQGIWDAPNSSEKYQGLITMSQKLELLAYFRLLTSIKFNQKYQLIKFTVYHTQDTVDYLYQRQQAMLKSIVNMLPLLSKMISTNDVKLGAETEWQQKLSRFELTSLSLNCLQNSGLQQKYEEDINKIWNDRSGLQAINELANVQLVSLCMVWLSAVFDQKHRQKVHPLLGEQKQLEARSSNFLKLMETLIRKTEFYQNNAKEIEPIISQFNQQIYLGSLSLTKEMLFTNSEALSSNLIANYESIIEKLGESVIILYKLGKHMQQIFQRGINKNDSRFKKQFKAVRRELIRIQPTIRLYEDTLNIRQEEESFKTESVSANKSRTIKNIY